MFLSEWLEFPPAPFLAGGGTWWQLASRCCWNRARPWHPTELDSYLVGLRTCQHFGRAVKSKWTEQLLNYLRSLLHNNMYISRQIIGYFVVQKISYQRHNNGCFSRNIINDHTSYLCSCNIEIMNMCSFTYTPNESFTAWCSANSPPPPEKNSDIQFTG